MSALPLLEGILRMPPLARERLSHLEVNTAGQACLFDVAGASLGDGLVQTTDLPGQATAVSESGLVGAVVLDQTAAGVIVVRTWSADDGQRSRWESRVAHAMASEAGRQLLAWAAQLREDQWRRDASMAQLAQAVRATHAAGVSGVKIAEIADVSRSTMYAALQADDVDHEPVGYPGAARAAQHPASAAAPQVSTSPAPAGRAQVPGCVVCGTPTTDSHEGAPVHPDCVPAHATLPLEVDHPQDTTQPAQPSNPAAPVDQAPLELVRMPSGHTAPCVICRTPATTTLAGHPVHAAACQTTLREQLGQEVAPVDEPAMVRQAPAPPAPPAPAPPAASSRTPRPERSRTTGGRGWRDDVGPRVTRQGGRARGGSRKGPEERFAGIAAAVDADWLYLPGGAKLAWQADHLGDLAALVVAHRLGWGGGETLPDRGEIWLYPAALERLGLPVDLELPATAGPEQREQRKQAFAALGELPIVADALAAGWQLDGGTIEARTRITHPQLCRAGAHLVMAPWLKHQGQALLSKASRGPDMIELTDPETLVSRLDEWARATGAAYRVNESLTGLDLLDILRPPVRPGQPRPAGRLVAHQAREVPPFLAGSSPRFSEVERVFDWWRPWDSLSESEQGHQYAIAYDHSAHFLTPYTSTDLGVADMLTLTGDEARWDGSERPAFFEIDPWEHPAWSLPQIRPAAVLTTEAGEQRVIVTCHTLKQLEIAEPGFTDSLTYHQAWVWNDHTRYLAALGKVLTAARTHPRPVIADTAKAVYAQLTQKLGSHMSPPPQLHLRGRDWSDLIVGAARTRMMLQAKAFRDAGMPPLVVAKDTIIVPTNTADPHAAWPGAENKYGTNPGQWKPIAIADLADWGPRALPPHGQGLIAWPYREGLINAMTPLDPRTGAPKP